MLALVNITHNKIKLEHKKTYQSWPRHAKPLDLRVLHHKSVTLCNCSSSQQPLLASTTHELTRVHEPPIDEIHLYS